MKIKLIWKILATTITSFILVAVFATPLAAEEPLENSEYISCCQDNQSNWHRGRYRRNYGELNQIETLDGEVVSVDTYPSRRGFSQGIHLLVDTGQETVEVHLAPSWYLEDQNFDIAPEDKIAIIGSRINVNGEQAIVASQITKGNETLRLRNENGIPFWHGHHRQR